MHQTGQLWDLKKSDFSFLIKKKNCHQVKMNTDLRKSIWCQSGLIRDKYVIPDNTELVNRVARLPTKEGKVGQKYDEFLR